MLFGMAPPMLLPSAQGQMPMLPTMPPVAEDPMAGGMGAPPMMGADPMMGAAPGMPPMGGGFPSTDPMAILMGLTQAQSADQAALAQQQIEALQMALSALVMQSGALPDPAAAAAVSEPGPVMAPGEEMY
jgi:hypothetical protein